MNNLEKVNNKIKKNIKLIILIVIQLIVFYILPLTASPSDIMGLIVFIILSTFVLGFVVGLLNSKMKYFYPVIISILFIPSIFIYYNKSACIYVVLFFISSGVSLLVGQIVNLIIKKIKNAK